MAKAIEGRRRGPEVTKLSKGQQAFLTFLSSRVTGDVVSEIDLLKATSWKEDTLATFRRKHFIDPFLSPIGGGKQYNVLRDGSELTPELIEAAFTQKKPAALVFGRGTRLLGQSRSYELLENMGAGAVGEVWKAVIVGRDTEYVAAKIVNPRPDLLEPTRLANVRERFRLEATNGSKLGHPNIVPIIDRGEFGGEPFLVMQLAEMSAQDALDRKGSLSLAYSSRMIEACAEGLRYLHSRDLIHRDVKPPNILFCDDRIVLGDLGIVRWTDMNPDFTGAGTLTRGSMQLGSWFYMAPEQQETPHEAVPASDVYALGITWYQLLTGKILTPAQIHAKRFLPPCNVERINSVIGKMIQYDVAERPQLDEVIAVVGDVARGQV